MALADNKLTMCWPNHCTLNLATVSGGSYSVARPLSNILKPVFAKKARTTNTNLASTQASIDLGSVGKPVHVVAIASHNLSSQALIRVSVYADQAKTTLLHQSGWEPAYPAVYETTDLEWEYDNFWFGTLTDSELSSFTPLYIYFLPEVAIAMAVVIEFDDQTNADTYVEFGRVMLADAWQPEINIQYGIAFGYENPTEVEYADDGTAYFDVKPPKRTLTFTFGRLTEDEAFNKVYLMKRNQGISKEILVAYNTGTMPGYFQRRFIGRQSEVTPLTHPFIENYSSTLNIIEIL